MTVGQVRAPWSIIRSGIAAGDVGDIYEEYLPGPCVCRVKSDLRALSVPPRMQVAARPLPQPEFKYVANATLYLGMTGEKCVPGVPLAPADSPT